MSLTRLQPNSVNKTANFTFANVTANYFIGDGSQITGISVSGGTSITNGTSNVSAALNGNVTIGVAGTNNVVTVSTDKLAVAGNVSATYFIGNGSQLTGISGSSTYANSNVADYLPTYTGNISANYFIGNGSTLTNITGANVTGYVPLSTAANIASTITTAAQPNITSVGTLSSLTVSGLITATGTGVKVANIQDTTGTITITTKYNNQAGDIGVYGNIIAGTSGTGNVTASYFLGNGSQLTGITATATPAGSNTQLQFNNAGSLGASSKLTWNGTLLSTENLAVTNSSGDEGGEILLAKPATNTTISGTGVTVDIWQNRLRFFEQGGTARGAYIDITAAGAGVGSNLLAGGSATAPGGSNTYVQFNDSGSFGGIANLTFDKATNTLFATNHSGNGAGLTSLTGANVTGYVPTASAANTAGTVTTAAQPNITSVGNLSSLTVTGNVSANYFTGNGSLLTGLTASPAGSNTQVQFNDGGVLGASSGFTFNKATGLLSVGSATGGSLSGANLISANYFTGTLTTAAQPNITSVGTLTSLVIGGQTTFQQSIEVLTTKTGATGTVDHDFSTGAIFYHTSPAANFTANFTNVPTTDNRVVVITLVMVQGATAYLPTAVQIGGVAQTIKWSGGAAPTGTSSGINPVTFALFRVGGAWTVTGVMGAYS